MLAPSAHVDTRICALTVPLLLLCVSAEALYYVSRRHAVRLFRAHGPAEIVHQSFVAVNCRNADHRRLFVEVAHPDTDYSRHSPPSLFERDAGAWLGDVSPAVHLDSPQVR